MAPADTSTEALRPTDLGAHRGDVTALEHAAETLDGGLMLITGADTALSYAVAHAVALQDAVNVWQHRTHSDPVEAGLDVHPAVPSSATWSVEEVERLILAPARLRPMHRGHVVVADAHRMSALAADRLLKAVEEPRTDVLFWFCTPSSEDLPTTLRARASRTLTVRPLPAGERLDALQGEGLSAEDAATVSADAADNARLALAAARHGRTDQLRTYASVVDQLRTGTLRAPSRSAEDAAAAVSYLAAALRATRRAKAAPTGDARTAWDRLDTAGKAEGRALLRELIDRCARACEGRIISASTPRELRALDASLAACARAHDEVTLNAHPVTVLGAFLSRAALAAQ